MAAPGWNNRWEVVLRSPGVGGPGGEERRFCHRGGSFRRGNAVHFRVSLHSGDDAGYAECEGRDGRRGRGLRGASAEYHYFANGKLQIVLEETPTDFDGVRHLPTPEWQIRNLMAFHNLSRAH